MRNLTSLLATLALSACAGSSEDTNLAGSSGTATGGSASSSGAISSNGSVATSAGAVTTTGTVGLGGASSSQVASTNGGTVITTGTAGLGGASSQDTSTSSGAVTTTGTVGLGGVSSSQVASTNGGTVTTTGTVGLGGASSSQVASTSGGTVTTTGTVGLGGASSTQVASTSAGAVTTTGTSTTGGGGCDLGVQHSGGTEYCSNTYGGPLSGGYFYQLWTDGTGSGCMTPYGGGDAAFKANWSNSNDFLARVGLNFPGANQTYDQLGTVSADFAFTKTGSGSIFSFIGIYGWSLDPMVEYYIVEDWYGNGPPTGGGDLQGTFSVDDGTYNVYTHTQVDKPSVTGMNATFEQYFSIRQTPRQCGHISITEHYEEWASLGMTLGNMFEAKMLVEVGGGTGTIDFTTLTVVVQ